MSHWDIETTPECTRIELRGVLGIAQAGALRLALLEVTGHARPAHVDGSALEHIDCAAAQVLLCFASAMERRQLEVEWSAFPDGPREYLELAGLLAHFTAPAPAQGSR